MDGDSYPPPLLLLNLLLNSFVDVPSASVVGAVLVILFLLFCSAVMSASEVAYFSLTKPELYHLKESEDTTDRRVAWLMERPRYLLSTILFSNNLVNIGIVILSYFITKNLLNFNDVYLGAMKINGSILEFIFNAVVVTFALVLFGEATPKVYATHNRLPVARFTASLFYVLLRVLRPINWLFINSTHMLEVRLKKQNAEIDIEEINKAIEITVEHENTSESKEEARILKGVVQLGNITVKQVMRPRMEIAAVEDKLNFKELLKEVNEKGYSRIPVFKDSIDNIVGTLYIKDLLSHLNEDSNFGWKNLLREPLFVPETKRVDDLLREIQESRKHLAIVVDEFGGTKGIITLEDIVEEVLGDIQDEFDEAEPDNEIRKISEGVFVVEGKTFISDLATALELKEDFFDEAKGEAETVGGLVLQLLEHIPTNGEATEFQSLKFTVIRVENNRVSEVKVEKQLLF